MKTLLLLLAVLCSQMLFSQDQMYDICPLKVGEKMPMASIYDAENREYSLSELTTDKTTVIIFYRGAWCGYCTKHLAELNDIKGDVEGLGYQIFGLTPDQTSKLEESTIRSKSEIPVYSDAGLEAIKAFGLDWTLDDALFQKYKTKYQLDLEEWSGQNHHSLPVPAIFVIKEGIVQFQYVNPNHRVRLKPETLLAVLKTI